MSHDEQQTIEVEAEEVVIRSQPIELYKVLKLANVVEGGGQAKHLIGEGYVAVNGELEQRKRRKIYDGDIIQFGEQFFIVLADEALVDQRSLNLNETDNQEPYASSGASFSPDDVNSPQQNPKEPDQENKKSRKKIDFF